MRPRIRAWRADVLADRWQLSGPLAGGGGPALVRAGRDLRTGASVVVKVLPPAAGPGGRPTDLLRLRHEAEALARLDHPTFVRLLDAGADGDGAWLVMERAPGRGLDRCIADGERPDARAAARAGAELADGLALAHGRGLLHRDIKPSNAVWDGERLRLVDWGLARVRGLHEDIDHGLLLGTLPYMAMEAWGLGGPVDERTDLYALAATLYEWLCGSPPFGGREPSDVLRAHREGLVDDPCRLRPDLPRTLGDVLLRALRREPRDRYQSARGLAVDLRRSAEAAPGRTMPLGSADGPGPCSSRGALVGRGAELRRILEVTRSAAEGRGRVILLEALPGHGRSRLLHEVAEPLRRRGALVLAARCASFDQRIPLDPIAQMLAHLRASLPTLPHAVRTERIAALRASVEGRAAGLIRLVPALGDLFAEEPEGEPRIEVLRDGLLGTALPGRPTVLVVDDVHRADPASQEVLLALARCAGSAPLVLLLSAPAEPGDDDGPAAPSLDEPARDFLLRVQLSTGRDIERIRLGGLGHADVEQWLDGVLGRARRDLADWLVERSGGAPQRLEELLRAVQEAGALAPSPAGWRWDPGAADSLDLGQEPGDLALARWAERCPRRLRVLAAAARIASEVTFDEVSAVLGPFGVDRATVASALAEAVLDGLLVPSGGCLRFRHSGLRRALAARWPEAAARPLHRRAREVLGGGQAAEALPDRSLFAVAHHALHDGSGADAAELLVCAASRARRRGDPTTAAAFAAAALERADGAHRGTAAVELAEAELRRGRLAAARRGCRGARLCAAAPLQTATAWAIEAEASEAAGWLDAAERAARAGLAALGRPAPETGLGRWRAAAGGVVGLLVGRRVPGGPAGRLLRIAARLTSARGAPEAPVLLLVALSEARRASSPNDRAMAWGALAFAVLERAGLRRAAGAMLRRRRAGAGVGAAWLIGCRGVLAGADGRPGEARQALGDAIERLRAAGASLEARHLLGAYAQAARAAGDLEGLKRCLRGEADRDPRVRAWSLLVSGWLASVEGEPRRARELASSAADCAAGLGDESLRALALAQRAAAWLPERSDAAIDDAEEALRLVPRRRSVLGLEARVRAVAVLVRAGVRGAARDLPSRWALRGLRGLGQEAARVRAEGLDDTARLRDLARQAEADGRWWDAAELWLDPRQPSFDARVAGLAALRRCSGVESTTLARRAEGASFERRLVASAEALESRLRRCDPPSTSRPGDPTIVWDSQSAAAGG